jgi:hypothetical protein
MNDRSGGEPVKLGARGDSLCYLGKLDEESNLMSGFRSTSMPTRRGALKNLEIRAYDARAWVLHAIR